MGEGQVLGNQLLLFQQNWGGREEMGVTDWVGSRALYLMFYFIALIWFPIDLIFP